MSEETMIEGHRDIDAGGFGDKSWIDGGHRDDKSYITNGVNAH